MGSKSYTKITKSFAGHIILDKVLNKKKYVFDSPTWLQHTLNKYNVGDAITITFTNLKPKRTEQQNRYYWLYLGIISKETGNDIDDLHTLFKGLFLSKEIVEVMGHNVRRSRSTTELNTSQFSDYIARIEEKTCILAPPSDTYLKNLYEEGGGVLPEYPENNKEAKF